jgi:hypothetical protein
VANGISGFQIDMGLCDLIDIAPSGAIHITDVLAMKPFFGASCT